MVFLLLFIRGQTLTKSKVLLLLTISHLTQNIQTLSGHRVFRVDTVIPSLISVRPVLLVPVPEAKVSNATVAVMLAALGTACKSAAGYKISIRVRKVLNQGGVGAKCCAKLCKQWLCHTAGSKQMRFSNQPQKHRRSSRASPKPSAKKFGDVRQRRFAQTRRARCVQT